MQRGWDLIVTSMVVVVTVLMANVANASAERRVALVIGNSAYEHVSKLPNPTNDAEDVAAALKRLNFEVTHYANLDRNGLIDAISQFSEDAHDADMATFFFAGHGIEIARQNYLVPVDAKLRTDRKVRYEAVSLEDVSLAMEGVKGLKMVLLDACRNNPFVKDMKLTSSTRSIGRGLAAPEPNVGSLISFAAKEGTVASDGAGRNSPYTRGLLANLEQPGLEINFLFRKVRDSVLEATGNKQEPFTYGSLPGSEIFLKPPVVTASLTPQTPQPVQPVLAIQPGINSQVENSFWTSIVNLNDIGLFERYIEKYPNGNFAEIARYRIAQISGQKRTLESKIEPNETATTGNQQLASLASPTAPVVNQEPEVIEDLEWKVQTELNRVGCSVGAADGAWGPGSRRGLRNYAKHSGFKLSGLNPTPRLYHQLLTDQPGVCPARSRQATAAPSASRKSSRKKSSRSSRNSDRNRAIIEGAAILGAIGILKKF